MSYEKIGTLVKRLLQHTEAGQLDWRLSETEGEYQYSFPSYVVRISRERSREDYESWDYKLSIVNYMGTEIEEINDVQLTNFYGEWKKGGQFLAELYELARRRAHGVEVALDELLKKLEEQDPPF